MEQYFRVSILVILVYILAEISPKAANWILVLILVGVVLGHWPQFAFLTQWLNGPVKSGSRSAKGR